MIVTDQHKVTAIYSSDCRFFWQEHYFDGNTGPDERFSKDLISTADRSVNRRDIE